MSLGSKIKSSELPFKTIQVFFEVFSSLPYDVIWKWDTDNCPGKPSNILLVKWLPQNDLLRKFYKLFYAFYFFTLRKFVCFSY